MTCEGAYRGSGGAFVRFGGVVAGLGSHRAQHALEGMVYGFRILNSRPVPATTTVGRERGNR